MLGLKDNWADIVKQQTQSTTQTPKTPYQQNVSQPVQQSQPTTREALGQLYLATQKNQEYGLQLHNQFVALQNDKGSMYYAPYNKPTNQAVSRLNEYGIQNVNQDWYNSTQFMDRYLSYNGQTNTPSAPTKKSSLMENIAYQRYQYGKGLEQTDKAKQECAALQEEINYLANWTDRNYSDDQIMEYLYGSDGSKFAKKYPTLAAMDNSMLPGNNLLELNEAIPYSKDWVYGNIWAARNDGGTGNSNTDMAMSALGYGNTWQENKDISARLDRSNPDTYAPYTVGSTTDDVCMYLGVTSYDKAYLNSHLPDQSDKTSVDMWNKGWDAADFTEKANEELEKFNTNLNRRLKNATDPNKVMEYVDRWLESSDYSHLGKLDKSTQKINDLVGTSSAIDFSRADILRKVNERCAENAARLNGGDTLNKNGMQTGTDQSAEAIKAGDQKVTDAADMITGQTAAEQNALNNTPSSWFDRVFQSFVEAKNPLAMMKANEGEIVTKSANNTITAVNDLMSNMKATRQLAALNNTNNALVERCDEIRDGFNAGTGMFSFMYDIEDGPTVKRGDADVANSRYAPALVELYETVTGESAVDADGAIRPGVIEKAQRYYDYIVNGSRTYEEDEEIPWLLDDYTETRKNLESEIQRTAGAEQKFKVIDLMWNARIAAYEQAGMDASELKAGRAIANSLYFFSDYDATDWQPYSYYDSMQKKMGEGASVADVLAESADYTQQAKDNMDTVRWELEYIKENNIQVPQEYLKNMQRYIDQNQRTLDDYVFYSLRGRDDFDEMVAKGKEIAKNKGIDSIDRFLKDNPMFSVMSEAEKDTVYYLLANPEAVYDPEFEGYLSDGLADFKDLSAGKDKGYWEANYYLTHHLADESYGVLHKRYADEVEANAKAEVDSGFLSGLWANVKAIASAPWEAIAGGTYWLKSLMFDEEYNPYNASLSLGRWSESVNSETINAIKNDEFFKEHPALADIVSGVYEILYNRGRSFANQATFSFLGHVTEKNPVVNELAGAAPMAAGAMSMETAHAKERGAQDWQAFAIGAVSFVAEDFTEGLTYGNIQEAIEGVGEAEVARSIKDMLIKWGTDSGIEEMIGETMSDVLSNFGDDLIMGALSQHNELVNQYLTEYGLDPNNPIDVQKANEMARKDEIAAIVHTAIISYLSPGLDVVSGSITDVCRDFNNVRIATKNMQKSGMNVSMNDVRKEYQASKKESIKEAQNAPAQQEEQTEQAQATQTETQEENPNFSVEDVDADALFNQNNEVSEQETSVAAPEKQMSTADAAFLNDLARLDAVENSDTSTQAGAIGALFGNATEAQQDTSKATASGITNIFNSMPEAVSEIKNLLTGAHVAFIDQQAVKTAIQNAALSESSEARTVMQSEEYQNASVDEQASMLASTVEADQANAAVQEEVAKATYENRIAEAEKELIRNGGLDSVKDLKAALDKAEENIRMAQESLEEKRAEVKAKSDALDAAVKESVDNPTPDSTNAVTKAAGELEKADTVQQEYEQHLDNIQRAGEAAQQKYDDAVNSAMRDIRQQAEAVVEDQNRQRAERDAKIAEQQRIAAEQAAQQQAEEDKRSGKQAEVDTQAKAEEWADQQHLEGQEREDFIQRVKDRQEQLTLGEIDMTGKLTNAEGYLAIMAFSRKTGLQFQLSDTLPAGTRGKYQNGVVYLNNNLVKDGSMTVGQALVEAALHEIPHSMEQTKNYQTYKKAALGYLYGSGADFNQAAYNAAIDTKINDYKKIGQNLTREQAEAEIVADFARTHLADKEVIQRFMDAGMGGKMRNTLHNINQALKNFFGKMTGEERKMAEYLRKAERGYQKAMNELAKTEIHPEGGQFSVQQIAQSMKLGMQYNEDTLQLYMPDPNGDIIGTGENGLEKGQRYFEVDGVEHRIEPDMIVNTPVGMLIDMGLSDEVFKDANGNEHTQKSDARKMFADLMNLCARYKDNNLIWEIAGSEFAETFSALKSNSDPQYKNTVDFGTICAKTQAIVDVLSQTMLKRIETINKWNEDHAAEIKAGTLKERVFDGLKREDIMMVYDQTHQANLTVPCPVCYVFSRWMGVPSLLGQMNRFQHEFVATQKDANGKTVYDENGDAVIDWDATQELVNKYLYGDGETQGILQKYGSKEAIADTKTSLQNKIRNREESLPNLNKALLEFQKELAALEAKEELTKEEKKKLKSLKGKIATKERAIAKNIRETDEFTEQLREVESYNWVSQALCLQHTEKGGKVVNDLDENGHFIVDRENFRLTPEEILFDLNRTGEFAGYAKNWKYRTTRGAGMGKAIMPYSGASIGDIINGDAIRWQQDQNPFSQMDREAATKAFENAKERVRKQNLVGGQRFQSTSDFRPEWGLDYVMSFLEMQALGSKVQMYTKVAEAVDFLGSIGADVNLSIMASGNGFHEATAEEIEQAKTDKELASRMGTLDGKTYVMDFSDVTGMDYNTAKGKTKKFNNVQMILVGMNDIHIKLALGNEDIDFIIPWHSSGNSKDVLQQLVASVDETLTESSDYTDFQTDQIKSHKEGTGKNEKTIDDRTDIEIARWNARLKILTGVANKDVNLEKPNEGGFGTVIINGEEMSERELVYGDKWLKQLYDRFYVEGVDPDCFGVKMPKAQAEQIFPYEYWDKTSTRENADVNGERFAEYCDLLGLVPRFSQFKDVPGYWKLLIDRKMYDNNILNDDGTVKEYGKYREQNVVDVTKARMDTDASQELGAAEKRKQDVYQLPESTTARYGKNFSKEVQDAVYNANSILEQKYDVTGQASFYGDMTDADIDQALMEANADYMAAVDNGDMKTAQQMVDEVAEAAGYTYDAFHGSPVENITSFDKSKLGNNTGSTDLPGFFFVDRRNYAEAYLAEEQEIKPEYKERYEEAETIYDKYHDQFSPLNGYFKIGDRYGEYVQRTQPERFKGFYDPESQEYKDYERASAFLRNVDDDRLKLKPQYTNTNKQGKVYGVKLKMENPYIYDAQGESWTPSFWGKIKQAGASDGGFSYNGGEYDGIIVENFYDFNTGESGTEYVVFDPEQIKSSDPVTYDDNGNVIPLSERFNVQNSDIRFSAAGDMTDADIDYQLSKNGLIPNRTSKSYSGSVSGMINGNVNYYASNGMAKFENAPNDNVIKNLEIIGMQYNSADRTWTSRPGRNLSMDTIVKAIEDGNKGIRATAPTRTANPNRKQRTTMAQQNQNEVNAGLARPMEWLNPLEPSSGKGQRQFGSQTVQNVEGVTQWVKDYLKANSDYDPDTNDEQINRAVNWLLSKRSDTDPDGFWNALDEIESKNFNPLTADGQARMFVTMSLAAGKNDDNVQKRLAAAINKQGTAIGQALQARKLFRLMTPAGRIAVLQREVDNVNAELRKAGKEGNITLDDWITKAAAAAQTEEEFRKAQEALWNDLAAQLPVTWFDRIQAWRMVSMLGNVRTHGRNMAGNTGFMPLIFAKNKIGAVLESAFLKEEDRTKALKIDKSLMDWIDKDAERMQNTLTGEAKYNDLAKMRQNKKVFGKNKVGQAVQVWSDFSGKMLEKEDWIFLKHHYKTAMGNWMTAHHVTGETLEKDSKLADKARTYAIEEAQKATYRDANKVAEVLNKMDNVKGLRWISTTVLPFKKTPMNILKRGLEYSPVGLLKTIAADSFRLAEYNKWANGKKTEKADWALSPAQYIDRISAGLTGTGVAALGALMKKLGLLRLGFKKKDPEDEFARAEGKQEYSIEFEILGHDVSYTIDWLVPSSMSLFVGAALEEYRENGELDFGGLLEGLGTITEPIWNLSMVDGLSSVFKTNSYDDTEPALQILENIGMNWINSLFPTALGQISRIADPARRKSYVTPGSKPSSVLYQAEKVQNKTPFSVWNIPYRNHRGEEERASVFQRAFENIISPGYLNISAPDETLNELHRLYSENKNVENVNKTHLNALVPSDADNSFSIKGQTIKLNAEQYDQMDYERKQIAYGLLDQLMADPYYSQVDDAERMSMVYDVWTYATQQAKYNQFPQAEREDWITRAQKNNIDMLDVIKTRSTDHVIEAQKEGWGNYLIDHIQSGDYEEQQRAIESLELLELDDDDINKIVKNGFVKQYQKAYKDDDEDAMSAIEGMLEDAGFFFDYEDWLKNTIKNEEKWLEDYNTP